MSRDIIEAGNTGHEATWLGKPLTDLSRQELIAALITMGKTYNQLCDRYCADRNTTYDMMRFAIKTRAGRQASHEPAI